MFWYPTLNVFWLQHWRVEAMNFKLQNTQSSSIVWFNYLILLPSFMHVDAGYISLSIS